MFMKKYFSLPQVLLTLSLVTLVGWTLESRRAAYQAVRFEVPHFFSSERTSPFYEEESIDPHAAYAMAHVASMAEMPDETLVATWYAGSGEVEPDVSIYFSSQKKGERTWSAPRVIMTRDQASHDLQRFIKALGNALIVAEHDGTLRLLYVTVSLGRWSGSMLNFTSSHDGGMTWESSRRLLLSPFFNWSELVKNAPTRLQGGGWAIPVYQEFLGKFPEMLWLLPDPSHNLQATKTRVAGGCSFFQPTMTALDETNALLWCRDYRTSGKITMAQSDDAGVSWSHPEPTSLPNHDSGIASLRLQNGWLLLAFNDGETSRNTLRLALSQDAGKTWRRIATIAQAAKGDFSYPYFLQTRNGTIHLLYSWNRKQIHHVLFNQEQVLEWCDKGSF